MHLSIAKNPDDDMATHRQKGGYHSLGKFLKAPGRPRYLVEAICLFLAICFLYLAYRYYFGDVAETFNDKLCGKPLKELCMMKDDIIDACKVTSSCEDVRQQKKDEKIAKESTAPMVLVEVFYEVLCPDSKDFVIDQVYPTVQKIGSIVNMSMVPYGKAKERRDGEEYEFTCQHGQRECKGNMIQTCAVSLLESKDRNLAISFINCMEISHDPSSAGLVCAKDVGIDFKPIEACAGGKLGNQLEHIMAQRTKNLKPALDWVPWIVVNGVHTEEIQRKGLSDLRGLICDTYKGPRPPGCDEKN